METARPSSVKMRELPAMLASPRLQSVAHLDLGIDRRGHAALNHLCAAPALPRRLRFGCNPDNLGLLARRLRPGLEGLDLTAYSYGLGTPPPPAGLADLLRSEGAAGLRWLSLSGSPPGEAQAALVAALPLRRLEVHGRGLTPSSLMELAGPALRALTISSGPSIPAASIAGLRRSACRDSLEELVVTGWSREGGVAPFPLPRLRRLRLHNCFLDPASVRILAEGGTFSGLTELSLWSSRTLGEAGVAALTSCCPEGPRLLDLGSCGLGDAGLRRLASWRGVAGVRVLMLMNNDLTDTGLLALAESPHAAALEGLSLDHNRSLTPAGLGPLLRSPLAARLTWLSVEYIGGGGAEAAPFEMSPPPRLRELRLGRYTRWTRVPGRMAELKAAMPGCAIE